MDPAFAPPPRAPRWLGPAFCLYALLVQALFLTHFLAQIAGSSPAFRRLFEHLPDWLR